MSHITLPIRQECMYNQNMKKATSGFTIVELLIVIVVIGILAAIVIVTYNGVQARATATKLTTSAKTYEGILKQYKAVNGDYPDISAETGCPGSTYPAATGFTAGTCGTANAISTAYVIPALDNALKTISPTLPDPTYKPLSYQFFAGDVMRTSRGIEFFDDSNTLYYYLPAGSTCKAGTTVALIGATQCEIQLP